MKRFLGIIILGIFLCGGIACTVPKKVQGYDVQHQKEAETLQLLGLFRGTDKGLELEKVPTRIQGAVMLVRLLGKEKIALEKHYDHPFTDVPSWADDYIGYMYKFKLTHGSSSTTFSPDRDLSAVEYTTFVLRSLGYDDSTGDFQWNKSLEKAQKIDLLNVTAISTLQSKTFLRDDMVWISYLALTTALKNEKATLIEKLVEEEGAVSVTSAKASGLYPPPAIKPEVVRWPAYLPEAPNIYKIENSSQVESAFATAMLSLQKEFTLQYQGDRVADLAPALAAAQAGIAENTGLISLINSWSYSRSSDEILIRMEYRYTNEQLAVLQERINRIIDAVIRPEMNDYQKEIAFHDYIIAHTEYDYENLKKNSVPASSYTAYGILLLGRGVCQGYAEAMAVLCRKAGMECMVINGEALSSGEWDSHSWNIIKVDGTCYHLDVTWDDQLRSDGQESLRYSYFNLTDQDISINHKWERSQYPSCSSTEYNYFAVNGILLDDYSAFKKRVESAVKEEKKEILLKVKKYVGKDYENLNSLIFSQDNVRKYTYSIDSEQGIIHIYDLQYW